MIFSFLKPSNTYTQRRITLQWICYNDVFNIAILQCDLLLMGRWKRECSQKALTLLLAMAR
jgi:hypothetical protein